MPQWARHVYINAVLLVVLYECETRFLKLWEERILRMIDKGVLQTIFRPEREELTSGRRKQREKLHDMRSSPIIL